MERYQICTNSFDKLKTVYNDTCSRFVIQDIRLYGCKNEYKFVFFAAPAQFELIKKHVTNNYNDVVIDKCKKL